MSGTADSASDEPRQGEVLPDVKQIVVLSTSGDPEYVATPHGVVVTTQCCDLARGGNGHPTVAAIVRLSGADLANAKSGKSPRYVALPGQGDDAFADMGVMTGVRYGLLAAGAAVPMADDVRPLFGQRVARRFGRFAYPDEVHPLLSWIRNKIRSKADSETSPLGLLLSRVETIRVENENGWQSPQPWRLHLVFVLRDGELPTLADEPAGDLPRSDSGDFNRLASRIAALPAGATELRVLWQQFCDALAAEAFSRSENDERVVAELSAEALEADEFSYARYIHSADLDIDDLSDSARAEDQRGPSA